MREEAASEKTDDKLQVYLKIIDYKRSIGVTQWTVLSIFVTFSQAVLLISLDQSDRLTGALVRALGVLIYWFGFLLYNRYRGLNRQVSSYLEKLEQDIGYGAHIGVGFQGHLQSFHERGLSTRAILILAGVLYAILAAAMSLI